MIYFISGLPGSGKSSVGQAVAKSLGYHFIEADALLPLEYQDKIARSELLSESELDEWVMNRVIPEVVVAEKQNGTVVCAGLLADRKYVEFLEEQVESVQFINLVASYEVLKHRVSDRKHFVNLEILDQGWEQRNFFRLPGSEVSADRPFNDVVAACEAIIKTPPNN